MNDRLPPLNALRAFECVARHLSFKKAAEELFVTPAAVSHQVKTLEQHLGVTLFNRFNRAIELTDQGRMLFLGVHDGLEQLKVAVDRVKPLQQDNTLVIGTGPSFAAKWLSPRLYRFFSHHPEIDARISANLAFSEFGPGGVDVAIRFGQGNHPGLFAERLATERLAPVCAPQLQLNSPEDLRSQVLIHDESLTIFPDPSHWRDWLQLAGVEGIHAEKGPRFNHADHGIDAAIEGAGVVLARKLLAANDLRSGRLIKPFELELETNLGFYFVCPIGNEEKPKVKAFRDWLWAEFDQFNDLLQEL
ncbi:MAG: transcriptional regulator GcvA [Motiliproteus sp.]|nr:transcriptional regulator GcvA [Motiliproteus sp.]MCW9053328.1 transcriptional regulator GcvA [Motiliproteus sp.]